MDDSDLIEPNFDPLVREFFSLQTNDEKHKIANSAALLSLFYSGKLTQSAFKLACQCFSLLNRDLENLIPKNYDQCADILLKTCDEQINFTKTMYCRFCSTIIVDFDKSLRLCKICCNRV